MHPTESRSNSLKASRLAVIPLVFGLLACGPTTSTMSLEDLGGAGADAPAQASGGQAGVNAAVAVTDDESRVRACAPPSAPSLVNIARGSLFAKGSLNFPSPGSAFDGDPATNTGDNGNKDAILALDFGSERTLYRSVIHFVDDPPQRYKLQVSDDGRAWVDILRVHNPNLGDERVLPAVGARYLRLLSYADAARTEQRRALAAISEVEVFERNAADRPPGCGAIIYPALLDRSTWVASTNMGEGAERAIASQDQGFVDAHGSVDEGNPWVVKSDLREGSYVTIDLGKAQTFNQLYSEAEHQALLEYRLFASDDGRTWSSPIASGTIVPTGGDGYGPISFAPLTKRYVKLESRSESHGWWGFKTISLLDTHGATPPDDGDGVDLAWGRPTDGSLVHNSGALFDGSYATGVDDAGVAQVDLGAVASIARINLAFDSTVGGFTYRIQTSDDGTVWTKRQTVSMSYVISQPFVSSIAANYTCRYLRFTFGSSQPPTGHDVKQRVNEIEVFRSTSPRSVGRERL